MNIADIIPSDLLTGMLEAGYIKRVQHPLMDRVIYNYTAQTQYERVWNEATRQCRGLITTDAGHILARPWPKFFNYGEILNDLRHENNVLDLDALVRVTDKIDGSLGIIYPAYDGGCCIATRGSFTSEQANVGTDILRNEYKGWRPFFEECTYLFEIVYPTNRIVVDYGDMVDLVFLGWIETSTGRRLRPQDCSWPGPRADVFEYKTLADALAAEPRPNCEGTVVELLPYAERQGDMIKLKQEDYVELHRLVTGLSEKRVWEQLAAGTVENLETVPEEFRAWVEDVKIGLHWQADNIYYDVKILFEKIVRELGEGQAFPTWTRKDFALRIVDEPLKHLLFQLLDLKDIRPAIWQMVKPSGERTFKRVTEDVA